jgi:acetyltransferase-like isoleucine patch superfamily enzyme
MEAVILPVLGANMSHGVIRKWFKQEGDRVEVGNPLFEVETEKINAEVDAEVAGILRQITAAEGERVPVLAIVAFIGGAEEPLPDPATWHTAAAPTVIEPVSATEPELAVTARAERISASPAARRLARELGVDLGRVHGTGSRGEITRADVESAKHVVATSGVPGRLEEDFFQELKRDAEAFRALSSEMKVHLYRSHGAEIGEGVRIEAGAVIIARELRIGAASSIGEGCTIECECFVIGRLSAFGKRARVRCRSVEIGDALWCKDDVVIGGGGSNEPGATLKIGDAAFIGEAVYLNPGHPISLGDEVCIGARAMLFTHSHWQSILRGYSSVFGPIEVGDHVFIGNQAFVFPGVSIASGVTVTVNSFVAVNVGPNALVGGVPAQVIRHVKPPSRKEQIELIRQRLPELEAILREQGNGATSSERGGVVTIEAGCHGYVCFVPSWPMKLPERSRLVVLTFLDGKEPAIRSGTTLFDLSVPRVIGEQDRFSDEVREFCRRRGIRFRPFAWRYGVGHFEGARFCARPAR